MEQYKNVTRIRGSEIVTAISDTFLNLEINRFLESKITPFKRPFQTSSECQ